MAETKKIARKYGHKRYRDKEWLRRKYVDEKLSTHEIAEICDGCARTISTWLNEFDIPARGPGGTSVNHMDPTAEFEDFFNGLILGDGHIFSLERSAGYSHADKHREYIEWLLQTLRNFGIKETMKIKRRETEWGVIYSYKSKCYRELKQFRERFYQDNKKVVPPDIEFPPDLLFNWYVGDGSTREKSCRICVNNFTYKDRRIIIKKLKDLGFDATNNPNTIRIKIKSRDDFLNYLLESNYRPPCYGYKFPKNYDIQRNSGTSYSYWSDEEVDFLVDNYKKISYREIGEEIGRTHGAVKHKASSMGLKAPSAR